VLRIAGSRTLELPTEASKALEGGSAYSALNVFRGVGAIARPPEGVPFVIMARCARATCSRARAHDTPPHPSADALRRPLSCAQVEQDFARPRCSACSEMAWAPWSGVVGGLWRYSDHPEERQGARSLLFGCFPPALADYVIRTVLRQHGLYVLLRSKRVIKCVYIPIRSILPSVQH
jgi:hypothetical protein